MDNIKNLVGDAGTFLTRAVQVSDFFYDVKAPELTRFDRPINRGLS